MNVLKDLIQELPPVIWRTDPRFRQWAGVGPRRVANMDSLGQGPKEKIRMGGHVGYPRAAFVEWLMQRIKIA